MKKEILVNRSQEETRVAIMDNGQLIDLFIERRESEKIVGNIYKGQVKNVLPGLSSAFVDVGLEKNAYLYVDDVVVEGKESKKIEKMLTKGQEIILQVDKEPIGSKGAKATMDVSMPGRLLVYMPFNAHVGISKNIESRQERDRLKSIINELKPETGGFIVRTEAEDASDKEIRREMKYLMRMWENVNQRFKQVKSPALLHRDLGVVFQTVRDYFNEDVDILMVDSNVEYREVREFARVVSPELSERVQLYPGKTPIFKAFGIEDEIRKLRSNRVTLPSGGWIIIQEAESLCAIDVNTGKFTGSRSQEETVTITNIEAAKEIARQLRLRNIGGIIVIDFIDMKREKNRRRVLEEFGAAVKGDKAKIKMWPITKLGLVEMTRERKRESLFAVLGETCPVCHGIGVILSKESLFIQINQELQQLKLQHHHGKVRIRLNPAVVPYFKERSGRLKNTVGDAVDIQGDVSIHMEDYQIIVE